MSTISTETRLEVLEREIMSADYEAFFYVGERLAEIRTDRLYEQHGFTSWSEYCRSGRLEFKKSYSDSLIRAYEIRPKLPDLPSQVTATAVNGWTEKQVRELTRCKTDKDIKRVATKVIAEAKRQKVPVSAKLVAKIRDAETTKLDRELEAASLDKHLQRLATMARKWRTSLEQIDLEQWDSVKPETLIRVKTEVDALLKYLRS